MSHVFNHPTELEASIGTVFGPTDWLAIEQDRIDTFADATGDHQWIHVDPERAKTGPFGATIAHGYLTLSLINYRDGHQLRP
jgi:acyl dehydratase